MYQLCKDLIQLMAATLLIMTYDSSVKMFLVAKTSTRKGRPDYVCEYNLNELLFSSPVQVEYILRQRGFVLSMR